MGKLFGHVLLISLPFHKVVSIRVETIHGHVDLELVLLCGMILRKRKGDVDKEGKKKKRRKKKRRDF